MINKIYVNIKNFIKDNYLILLFYIVFMSVMLYPLPYYIYTGGGIINVNDKINVENETKSKGTYNMCYVSEINATLPTYILSNFISTWDLIEKEEVILSEDETTEELLLRDKIYLEQANQNALLTSLKHANYNYQITNNHLYIIYVEDRKTSNLKIGDEIIEIENNKITSVDDITNSLLNKNIGDKVEIKVLNNNKELTRYAYIKENKDRKILGISLLKIYDINTNIDIDFHFSKTESGPSGGLILSLALYDKLVEEDITKGYKIAGTGTIDENGNVGEIGGVKYKLKGAVDNKANVFIVPNGDNYNECIKLQKKYNYDIKIIGVDTFEDALNELNKLK